MQALPDPSQRKSRQSGRVLRPAEGGIAKLVSKLLKELGEDPKREGLKATPDRVERSLRELTSGASMAVADVIESMGSPRPYRSSLGLPAALDEIERNAGRLYDADVAAASLRLMRDKAYPLPV